MVGSISISVAAEDQHVRGIRVNNEFVVDAVGGVLDARVVDDGHQAGTAGFRVDVVDVVVVVGVGRSVVWAFQPSAAD